MTNRDPYERFKVLFEKYHTLKDLFSKSIITSTREVNVPTLIDPELSEHLDALLYQLQKCLNTRTETNDLPAPIVANLDDPYVCICKGLISNWNDKASQAFIDSGVFDPTGIYAEVTGSDTFSETIQNAVNDLAARVGFPLVPDSGRGNPSLTD